MIDKWDELRYFTRGENWGDPDKMDREFLIKLDNFRHAIDIPFHVLEGYATSGHVSDSMHYQGRAVDGRFIKDGKAISMDELLYIALLSPFTGIGLYTWGHGGPFVHFDDRVTAHGRKSVWVSHAPQKYEAFTKEALKLLLTA